MIGEHHCEAILRYSSDCQRTPEHKQILCVISKSYYFVFYFTMQQNYAHTASTAERDLIPMGNNEIIDTAACTCDY